MLQLDTVKLRYNSPGPACPLRRQISTVDVRTGEKVYIEGGTSRKYRLKDDGTKAYEDEKPRPVYGGAATWAQGGARPASGSM